MAKFGRQSNNNENWKDPIFVLMIITLFGNLIVIIKFIITIVPITLFVVVIPMFFIIKEEYQKLDKNHRKHFIKMSFYMSCYVIFSFLIFQYIVGDDHLNYLKSILNFGEFINNIN